MDWDMELFCAIKAVIESSIDDTGGELSDVVVVSEKALRRL